MTIPHRLSAIVPRRSVIAAGLAMAALAAAGCGSSDTSSSTSAEEGSRTYQVGYSSTPGVGDLGTLLAWDELRKQGIDVQTKFFADPDVVIQSLARGDIDLGTNVASVTTMQAINQGVPLQIFMGYVGAEFVLGGSTEIQKPEDLAGKTIAVHSETSATKAYTLALVDKYDIPDVKIVIIPNSSARAQALEQGQIDAAPIDLADATLLQQRVPDKVHIVLFFGEEFDVLENSTISSTEFLEANGEDAQTITDTLIETYRKISEDPEWAAEESLRFLGAAYPEESDLLKEIVRDYAERGLWDPNGGLSTETAQSTVDFNETYSDLDADDELATYFNFDFVNASLEELGEQ